MVFATGDREWVFFKACGSCYELDRRYDGSAELTNSFGNPVAPILGSITYFVFLEQPVQRDEVWPTSIPVSKQRLIVVIQDVCHDSVQQINDLLSRLHGQWIHGFEFN